jgi:hypothetical protein
MRGKNMKKLFADLSEAKPDEDSMEEPEYTGSSPSLKRILDASAEITMNPETPENEKAFLARQLVQVTLPHSNPGNVPIWKRKNGNLTLSIRSGWNHKKDKPIGYPYGTVPRLLLFWLTTETLRTNSRRLELGNSLAAFMRDIGLDPERGGPRSDACRLRDQMERLFRATISFDYQQDTDQVQCNRWLDMQVAPKGELWWDIHKAEQTTIWGSWIELGEDFHNALISAPVPVDMRALQALKKSPLALDLYAWATWRSFTTAQSGKAQFIPWRGLMQQLGADYTDPDNFRKKVKATIRKVQAVYPGLKIEDADGGFNILPSSTPAVHGKTKRSLQRFPTRTNG